MYIDNISIKKSITSWLLFMFWIISIMIIVGGLTRLTDSGLSITQWELFSGFIPPLTDISWNKYFDLYKEIPEFKLQNYDMTMAEFKVIFWWEWIHRFLGRLIGISFLIPLIYFTYRTSFKQMLNYYLIFFLICFQGFIGWYMVQSGLVNNIDVSHFRLSIHLLFAFIILSLIFWNYLSLVNLNKMDKKINNYIPEFFLLLIYLQIIIGAFVSGMDAGKIYNTWPLMGNSYFPDDNKFISLFKLSAFSDPSLVQYLHRNLAYLIFIIFILISYITYRNKIFYLFKAVSILGLIILLQIILGILTVLSGASILTASLHQFSSILLVTSSLYFLYKNRFS
mgnify:CR=1 FL=1